MWGIMGESPCAHWFGGGFAAPTLCREGRASWEPGACSQRMLSLPFHPKAHPGAGWRPPFLLHLPCFSAQVIFRALSPPYAAENPYSAEVQALLKITNLRVRLLERQGCPCLGASPAPQPALHYAVYDFIVKGSCFCNGHADHCVPVAGFKPVKAAGVSHVVCACTAGKQNFKNSKGQYWVWCRSRYATCDALDSKNSEQKWSLQRRWCPWEAEVLNFLCVLVWDSDPSKVLHSNLFISGKSLKIIKWLTPIFPQMLTCNYTISKR